MAIKRHFLSSRVTVQLSALRVYYEKVCMNGADQKQQQQQVSACTITIDTKATSIDKGTLLTLLREHNVKTGAVEGAEIPLANVIPALRKGKTNVPELFYKELSSKLELPFLELSKIKKTYESEQKSKLISILPYSIVSKYKTIPLAISDSYVEIALDNPFDRKAIVALRCLFGNRRILLQVTSTESVEWAIENIYGKLHNQKAMLDLYNRSPDQSAYRVLIPSQKAFILLVIAAIATGIILNSAITFALLFAVVNVWYFVVNPIKIYISVRGFKGARPPTKITKGEMQWVFDEDLPVYTVLIPVYREKEVLAQNLRNMYRLNYPKEKLDVKILMEENDSETIEEAKKLGLFGSLEKYVEGIPKENYEDFLNMFDPVVVPSAKITTKPRACNYGLLRAKGELCVIYDAEDEPDPDQLRKAAIVFLRSDDNVACLQSKLNFYNADQNLLTKWFSIEYANWYEFYLQGLDWINAPIPLGGTSNHFRKKSLDELGRWDPYNVTEDADLGVRLARRKMKTEMIDTYTYEEATSSVKAWIRQRSRWYKGHVQTYLVHMRYPRKLLKDMAASQFLKFQLTFGAGIFIPFINPFLWVLSAISLIAPSAFSVLTPNYLLPICIFNLVAGNASYLLIYVIACVKLKKFRSIPLAIGMPAYWIILSVASWRGLIQLIKKPFYWDKTTHGKPKVSKSSPDSSGTGKQQSQKTLS